MRKELFQKNMRNYKRTNKQIRIKRDESVGNTREKKQEFKTAQDHTGQKDEVTNKETVTRS